MSSIVRINTEDVELQTALLIRPKHFQSCFRPSHRMHICHVSFLFY
jgi:hypothetical protein